MPENKFRFNDLGSDMPSLHNRPPDAVLPPTPNNLHPFDTTVGNWANPPINDTAAKQRIHHNAAVLTRDTEIRAVDLYSTPVEMAGIHVATTQPAVKPIDSRSPMPLLLNQSEPARAACSFHHVRRGGTATYDVIATP